MDERVWRVAIGLSLQWWFGWYFSWWVDGWSSQMIQQLQTWALDLCCKKELCTLRIIDHLYPLRDDCPGVVDPVLHPHSVWLPLVLRVHTEQGPDDHPGKIFNNNTIRLGVLSLNKTRVTGGGRLLNILLSRRICKTSGVGLWCCN